VERDTGDGREKLEAMRVTVEGCRTKIAQCVWSEEKENDSEGRLKEFKVQVRSPEEVRVEAEFDGTEWRSAVGVLF
jgi:structural maintenance of chromosome 2